MTNKMPVVGKRYRFKNSNQKCRDKIEFDQITIAKVEPRVFPEGWTTSISVVGFWEQFEELPENNLQESPITGKELEKEEATTKKSLQVEIGSRWQAIDGKVVTIDFVKNDLVVWTYQFNDREQMTLSTHKRIFIKDFRELKRK